MKKILFSVVILGMVGAFLPVWGQNKLKDMTGQRNEVMSFLTQTYGKEDAKGSAELEKKARDYFDWQVLRWTQEGNDIYIPYYRDDLSRIFRQLGENAKAFTLVNGQLIPILKKYANDLDEEMVVRYNAVLLLGDLSEKQVSAADRSVPSSDARKILETLLKDKNGGEPALRVAALRGLVRHAGMSLPDAEKERLSGIFDTYAFVKPSETEVESSEVLWMRDLALTGMAASGSPGAKGERVEKLLEIVGTADKYDLDTRTLAAQALGRMTKLTPAMLGKNNKPVQVYELVAKLAAEAITVENHRKYRLQRGLMEGFETRASSRYAETMSPEENAMQIRSLRQRTKALAVVFYEVLNPAKSPLFNMLSDTEKASAKKIAFKLRDIRDLFDKVGETRQKTQKELDRERERNPETETMEQRYTPNEEEIQYVKLRFDMEKQLGMLYDLLKLDKSGLELKRKRPINTMRY